jgi:glutamate---cysteine ligase / carboxylate-amine ligase
MNESSRPLAAFAGYGIELEYMIVDQDTLDVRPITDEVLKLVAGSYVGDVERGTIAWSNELVLHVIELKTNGPAPTLAPLVAGFQANVQAINDLLQPMNACLLPSAMHPWMDPAKDMRLWPHDYNAVYEAFDRIFNCQGHGWSNLQSMHINLPFADDQEFARLHAAIRTILPLLPALAASSPVRDGGITGLLDTRLDVYRRNCARIPSITGHVIPETIVSTSDYETKILAPMYRDIAPLDPEGILQEEWLNARGAIARFDRSAIEIRVLDIQECVHADIATAGIIVAVIEALYHERWSPLAGQQMMRVIDLERVLLATTKDADLASIDDRQYLDLFAYPEQRCEARELWQYLLDQVTLDEPTRQAIKHIIDKGPLARRILHALPPAPKREDIARVYHQLSACLAENKQYM